MNKKNCFISTTRLFIPIDIHCNCIPVTIMIFFPLLIYVDIDNFANSGIENAVARFEFP